MKTIALTIAVLLLLAFVVLLTLRWREHARVAKIWTSLQATEAPEVVFAPEMLDGLPEVAQRYLRHTIAPGTALARRVELRMTGSIQPKPDGPWMPFEARQILTPGSGFVWQALAKQGFLSMRVTDSYAAGAGKMHVALFGLVPMVNVSNPDVSKSAAGRLLAEYIWVPSVLLPKNGAEWQAVDSTRARVTLTIDEVTTPIMLTIDATGRLQEVVFPRWNDAERDFVPFGVIMEEEGTFGGYTIPSKIRAGWGFGTEAYREFFRATVIQAQFK